MRALKNPSASIRCLAYAPGGQWLASGGDDRVVRLWDLKAGRLAASLDGHEDWVRAIAFSPDGRRLASGSWDDTVHIWNVATRRLGFLLPGHAGGVWSLAFPPDGSTLAVGTGGGQVAEYHAERRHWGRPRTLTAHSWPVTALVFSPDSRVLASTGQDRLVKRSDEWGRELSAWVLPDWIRCLALDPAGRTLAAACDEGFLRLWDVAKGTVWADLAGHRGPISQVVFSPDGRSLLSAGWDGTVRVWDVAAGRERAALDWGIGPVFALAVHPDGMTAAAAGQSDTIILWDLDDTGP